MPLKPIEPKKKQRALIQAYIAQVEQDFKDEDYSGLDELLCCLMSKKENENAIFNYLGDNVLERMIEQKLQFKY